MLQAVRCRWLGRVFALVPFVAPVACSSSSSPTTGRADAGGGHGAHDAGQDANGADRDARMDAVVKHDARRRDAEEPDAQRDGSDACTCEGKCTAQGCLVKVASSQDHPSSVAVYDTDLFWTDEGSATVMRGSRLGGTPVVLYAPSAQVGDLGATPTSVGPILVAAPTLYWWAGTTATLQGPEGSVAGAVWEMSAPLGGGAAAAGFGIEGAGERVGGIAAARGGTFWADTSSNSILTQWTSSESSGTDVGPMVTSPFGLVTDGSDIYWTIATVTGSVVRAKVEVMSDAPPVDADVVVLPTLTFGSPQTLAEDQNMPGLVALDATSVYWTDVGAGTVMKVAKSGGTSVTLASGQQKPYGIAVAEGEVYWTNAVTGGAVMKVATSGGAPTTLAAAQDTPYGLAVAGTTVFWTTYSASGSVMKLQQTCGCP